MVVVVEEVQQEEISPLVHQLNAPWSVFRVTASLQRKKMKPCFEHLYRI